MEEALKEEEEEKKKSKTEIIVKLQLGDRLCHRIAARQLSYSCEIATELTMKSQSSNWVGYEIAALSQAIV